MAARFTALMRLAFPPRWWPPVLWLAFILTMTSWPRLDLAALASGGDKAAHLGAYAVLGALSARAAYPSPRPLRTGLAILAGILVIGMLDELHQSWIPGRATDVADWFADGVGGCLGILVAPLLPTPAHRRRDLAS